MPMSQSERDDLDFRLGHLFKPTMPINREDLFSGRRRQSSEVIDAINQNGQHVILYGERGTGKTSLANMIFLRVGCPGAHLLTPHINCTSGATYNEIWSSVFNDLLYRAGKQGTELPRTVKKIIHDTQNALKPEVTPELVLRLIANLWENHILIVVILDEFDTIRDNATRLALAETVKYLSDRNSPGTIVLVGVSDDVESLVSHHQSVERCLRQVRMPRMTRDEIEDIITNPINSLKMKIEDEALHEISRIAVGLPHYAHLLGLHSGRQAVQEGSFTIYQGHVGAAIKSATTMGQVTLHNAFTKATISSKRNALYKQVLVACALADTDAYGYFSPSDIREPLERILNRTYGVEAFARHLHAFSEPERGPVLRRLNIGARSRFRFENPLMQAFVVMKGLDEEIIDDEDLRVTRDPTDGRLF